MVDIPGNSSTTATLTVGGSATGTLEVAGDHDWFKINLTSGQSITVALNAVGSAGVEDPYLRIRDSAGNVIWENDDGGAAGLDSLISFSASYTGVYYIDVGAWDSDENGPGDYTGDYQVSVTSFAPPSVGTNDQIAQQLTHGYWGGSSHHFNVTQGGSLTVNLTALTPEGQNLARSALQLWSDIIGVNFVEVTGGAQITFDDDEEGAFATAQYSGGITSSAIVNVDAAWLADYGTALNGYAFQTYVHEIGHALGLGHAGNYNGEANYPFDASFANDSWAVSVMSYYDQTESSYYSDLGFTKAYAVTPMVADIIAIGKLYGLSTTTRTGDTTYGVGSNAGRAVYDSSLTGTTFTIFDSGGNDTINYSSGGFGSAGQLIDLNPEAFSNIGGRTGNLVIARGTIIENAISGGGNDELRGNAANNFLSGGAGFDKLFGNGGDDTLTGGFNGDTLTGGAGADSFRDTTTGLHGDTIVDFSVGDRIVFTDATMGSFSFSLSGNTLTFSGGSLTLTTVPAGTITASSAAEGGVQLTVTATTAPPPPPPPVTDVAADFNGDGRSDVLWRHDDGTTTYWLGQAGGGFATSPATYAMPTNWTIVGIGDFSGDNRDDIIWRHDSGVFMQWLGQASGGFAASNATYAMPTDWSVAGTGDFNGDGRDDVVWRHESGVFYEWMGQANGSFVASNATYAMPTDWSVDGTGDFNGDGRDDIVWRHDSGTFYQWMGQADGSFAASAAVYAMPTDWSVSGAGDFNGDGRDDILWRHDSGTFYQWMGQANGSFAASAAVYAMPTQWSVVSAGDFNGDGRDDILWQHSSGDVLQWMGQANGSFAAGDTTYGMAPQWQVQPTEIWG